MNKFSENNLAEKIFADSEFEQNAAQEIKKMIDDEMSKPKNKRDYSKVKELTSAYCEITGADKYLSEYTADKMLSEIEKRAAKNSQKLTKKYKVMISLAAAAVLIVGINCFSVLAFDMDIISAIIQLTEGGFTVDFKDDSSQISLPISENDPFGFIAECAKYDVYLEETPHYIPEGFVLESTDHNENSNFCNSIRFMYRKDDVFLSFNYAKIFDSNAKTIIPSDEYNISETTVNGSPAIVSKEDNQYTILYIKNDTEYLMFSDGLDYEECEKIVASIK